MSTDTTKVRDVLATKGRDVVTLPGDATVVEAARLMTERGIGCVLIADAGVPVGVFTERDVLRRVVAERGDPATVVLRDVMTSPVITCTPETALDECAAVMTARRIRHLPVMHDGALAGVVSSGDVMAFRVAEQQTTITHLSSYVFDTR
ncbi:MAG: CBS domain-containing protein [Gemmatimonadaceae bacterium]